MIRKPCPYGRLTTWHLCDCIVQPMTPPVRLQKASAGEPGAAPAAAKGRKRQREPEEEDMSPELLNPDRQPDIPGTTQQELREKLTLQAQTIGEVHLQAIEPGQLYEYEAGVFDHSLGYAILFLEVAGCMHVSYVWLTTFGSRASKQCHL